MGTIATYSDRVGFLSGGKADDGSEESDSGEKHVERL